MSRMDDREVKSLAELLAEPPSQSDWGPWRLRAEEHVLSLPFDPARPDDEDLYWIDLMTCLTSAVVLDWIMQIAGKTWATDRILAGLVRAFDDVLKPQSTLCSRGQSTTITAADIRARVRQVSEWGFK